MINLNISSSDIKKYSKFLVLALVVLIAAGAYFLWLPQYQEFRSNLEELSTKEEEIKLKKEHNRELEGNLNLLLDYKEKISKIETALPQEFSIASIVSFIQNKSSENGLILKEINLSSGAASAVSESSARGGEEAVLPSGVVVKNVAFNIVSSGRYSSFKNFLSSVWISSRLVNVSSISFEASLNEEETGTGASDIFDFNLELAASYYAPSLKTESSETATPSAK